MPNYFRDYPSLQQALPSACEDTFEQSENIVGLAKSKALLSETVADSYRKSVDEVAPVYDRDAQSIRAMLEGEQAIVHALRPTEFTRFSIGGVVMPSAFMYEIERRWYQNALSEISGNARAKMANILESQGTLKPGDFRELDRELTMKTKDDYNQIFSQIDWFYKNTGPSSMLKLSPILSHVGLRVLAASYDQQTLTPEGLIMSDALMAAETIFKCATPAEQTAFITRQNIANMMKRFARRMVYYCREGVARPEDALGMTTRQVEIMHNIHRHFGDPLDQTRFEASID